ncbi:MAG: TIGR00159 family protein [Ignavibacteria bacterium]|nr:TIGR00159 family protein [Ignavibacteria bacterium]MBK7032255.1 TIGR00159 family protein [Ignavibacteria bacterium]MBK7412402.1 TIGR00159 family protein [Ignavibacteria bacterium]
MNELLRIGFLAFTWIDLVDVLLITVLFYVVYHTLRDTLAVQILIVLGLVLILSFVTDAAGMKTVNWVLRRIGDIGLIAFVVLFQPELRRVLLILTQSRLFRVFVRSSNSETIDDVITSVTELTAKHIGALIVFSRAEHIKVTVDTGVELHAAVSSELLLSIFNPRSPLHDGAVVIDNRSLVAARCVLPLSSVQRIGTRNLGTRHRAGLGLAEQADVVVLILSEERGTASLAYHGELELDIPLHDLRKTLQERLAAVAAA